MPDHVEQNYHNTDAGTGKPTHPSQPAWVANWVQHRRNLSSQVLQEQSNVNDWDFKQAAGKYKRDFGVVADVPPSANELGAVPKARRSIFTNEKLFMNSEDINSAGSELLRFPLLNFNQKMETIWAPNVEQAVRDSHTRFQYDDTLRHGNATVETCEHHLCSTMLGMAPNQTGLPGKVICSQREHILQAREHTVITNLSLGRKSLPISRPPQEDLTGSTFTLEHHGFELAGTTTQSFMYRKKDTAASSSYAESEELLGNANPRVVYDCNHQSYSKSLLYDSNMDRRLDYRNSGSSYSGQNASQLVHDPSTRNLQFPVSVGEQGRNMNVFSDCRFLPSHISPLEMNKPEELNHGSHSPFRMPMVSPHDANRARMCTAVDTAEGVPGDSLKSVQKFHHLLMTKKTGVDLDKEVGMIREAAAYSRSKGKALIDLEKEDVRDMRTGSLGIKNESSADTDIMDIQIHEKRKHCLDVTSFPSKKDVMVGQNPAKLQATLSSSTETIGRKKTETNLFDLNQEPPSFLPSEILMEHIDLSTSRTASLDGEHSLSHATQLDELNSNRDQDSLVGMDPSNKLVKRFKSSASDSVCHDTNILRKKDASSVEKVSNKNREYIRTGEEQPMPHKDLGKEHVELGKTTMSPGTRGPFSTESVKERRDRSLSNSWIRRWCHDQSAGPLIKSSARAECKPQSSKETLDEFPTKQPPSIAAMALVGKTMTMTGFQECDKFLDNGFYVVWNSGEV